MPSSEERIVGCRSRCMCMILLHLHIGAVALMGPASVWPATWFVCDVVEDDSLPPALDSVLAGDGTVTAGLRV